MLALTVGELGALVGSLFSAITVLVIILLRDGMKLRERMARIEEWIRLKEKD